MTATGPVQALRLWMTIDSKSDGCSLKRGCHMDEQKKNVRRRVILWLLAGLMVVSAYPLSLGPVVGLQARGYTTPELTKLRFRFYRPLRTVIRHHSPESVQQL